MEETLKKLFDYQTFEKNPRLKKLISETENRAAAELSDDSLSLVNAAGETEISEGTLSGNPDETNPWHGLDPSPGVFEKGPHTF